MELKGVGSAAVKANNKRHVRYDLSEGKQSMYIFTEEFTQLSSFGSSRCIKVAYLTNVTCMFPRRPNRKLPEINLWYFIYANKYQRADICIGYVGGKIRSCIYLMPHPARWRHLGLESTDIKIVLSGRILY